jgi:probable HAF family extracellular repeat protein
MKRFWTISAVTLLAGAISTLTAGGPAYANADPTAAVAQGRESVGGLHGPTVTRIDINPPGFNTSAASGVNDRGKVIGYAVNILDSGQEGLPLGFFWYRGVRTTLSGGHSSLPSDINARGVVVGFCDDASGTNHGCLWRAGRARNMGTCDGSGEGFPRAINDKGEAVGECQTTVIVHGGQTRAFIWRHGVFTDLGGQGDRSASAINDRSQVIGTQYLPSGLQRGFLWQHGVLTDLGTLGGDQTVVSDINDRGQIVGVSTTATGSQHAFLWQHGRMIDLGALSSGTDSAALATNARGQVVGWATTAAGPNHAVLWNHRVLTDLGVLTPGASSVAQDINERGQVIGDSSDVSGHRLFLWQHGRMISINGPGAVTSAAALEINNHGLIVGWSAPTGSHEHATVWRLS